MSSSWDIHAGVYHCFASRYVGYVLMSCLLPWLNQGSVQALTTVQTLFLGNALVEYATLSQHLCVAICVTAAAVKVHLKSSEALEFLQKLVYIVLPGQNGFTGISSRALDGAGNLHFR